jgi:hypothetical protein
MASLGRIETKQVGSFKATDAAGAIHTLELWAEFHYSSDLATGEKRVTIRRPQIRTEDGSIVMAVEKGRYEVVTTGQILHSDDPNAPG